MTSLLIVLSEGEIISLFQHVDTSRPSVGHHLASSTSRNDGDGVGDKYPQGPQKRCLHVHGTLTTTKNGNMHTTELVGQPATFNARNATGQDGAKKRCPLVTPLSIALPTSLQSALDLPLLHLRPPVPKAPPRPSVPPSPRTPPLVSCSLSLPSPAHTTHHLPRFPTLTLSKPRAHALGRRHRAPPPPSVSRSSRTRLGVLWRRCGRRGPPMVRTTRPPGW